MRRKQDMPWADECAGSLVFSMRVPRTHASQIEAVRPAVGVADEDAVGGVVIIIFENGECGGGVFVNDVRIGYMESFCY